MTLEHQAYCDATAGVLNRTYPQRHGGARSVAPDGTVYMMVQSQARDEVGLALGELEARFRAIIVDAQGDTIWWRAKPEVIQDAATKKWTARTRFCIGFKANELPQYTPGSGHPDAPMPCYPDKTEAALPEWRSHKVVRADKIISVREKRDGSPTMLVLACGLEVELTKALRSRIPEGTLIASGMEGSGGYFVRYEDGFESWSPAKAFEDGYTRIEA